MSQKFGVFLCMSPVGTHFARCTRSSVEALVKLIEMEVAVSLLHSSGSNMGNKNQMPLPLNLGWRL